MAETDSQTAGEALTRLHAFPFADAEEWRDVGRLRSSIGPGTVAIWFGPSTGRKPSRPRGDAGAQAQR